MAAQTVLMDFILHENFDSNSCEQKVKDMLEEQLAKGGTDSNVLKVEMRHAGKEVDTVMYSGQGDLMIMIRIDKREKLLTLNIDGPSLAPTGSQFKDKKIKKSFTLFHHPNDLVQFEGFLSSELGVDSSSQLPVVARGMELSPYWTTTGMEGVVRLLEIEIEHSEIARVTLVTDDRIVECPIKSVLLQEISEYQKIQILDTIDFGR